MNESITSCPTCARLGRTCVMCEAERERVKRIAKGHVNTLTRLERDQERQAQHG